MSAFKPGQVASWLHSSAIRQDALHEKSYASCIRLQAVFAATALQDTKSEANFLARLIQPVLTLPCYMQADFGDQGMQRQATADDTTARAGLRVNSTTAAFLPVYAIIVAYFAFALSDAVQNGGNLIGSFYATADVLLLLLQLALPVAAAILLFRSWREVGREQMVSHAAQKLQRILSRELVERALPLLSFLLFLAAFVHFKMRIPQIGGFRWDDALVQFDQFIFGGKHAYEFFAPLYDQSWLIFALDKSYSFWIPGIFIFWTWMAYDPRQPMLLRRQYLLTTVLTWIIGGTVLATVFGSVGPGFYHSIYPSMPDIYAPLTARLNAINADWPLIALPIQADLYEAYVKASAGFVGGISAMPSMHNAQAAIFVLTCLRINRLLTVLSLAFGLFIVSGSILLGWHYVSDSIAGLLLALAIWHSVGFALRYRDKNPA